MLVFVIVATLLQSTSARFDPTFWSFIPVHKGELFPNGTVTAWSSQCFLSTSAQLKSTNRSGTAVVTSAQRNGSSCYDLYLFATNQDFRIHRVDSDGSHGVTFEWKNAEEATYVADYGLQAFLLPDGAIGSLADLALTLELFLGPKTATEQRLFMQEYLNWTFEPRANTVVLNDSDVMSGDYLGILKTTEANSGVSDMICYGTGSHTGHTAMALWMDGELYVVESTAELGPGQPTGIVKTPWDEWIETERKAGTMVAMLRLNDTMRAQFDVEKAVAFFQSVEGLPYGFHNFVFGWIDTPDSNYPPPLSAELFPLVFQLLDYIDNKEADKLVGQALNKRLNTTGLRMYQLFEEMERRNVSFYDVMSFPEQDSWVYSDGRSMVCSSFVMAVYKASGMFGDIDYEATEVTPKDSYQLNIYEHNWQRPAPCLSDPDLPYCQILGDYKLTLPGFNTVPPHEDMFFQCGGLPPSYSHPPTC